MAGERAESESAEMQGSAFGGCGGGRSVCESLSSHAFFASVEASVRRCGLFSSLCDRLDGFDAGQAMLVLL